MNTKHSWQTRATVKYIFFYFQTDYNAFLCDTTWLEVFFFCFLPSKEIVLQMVQLQGRRSTLCVFVIYASWLAFRKASIIHRMHVLYFCSEKVVLIKNVILCRVCTVNAVT